MAAKTKVQKKLIRAEQHTLTIEIFLDGLKTAKNALHGAGSKMKMRNGNGMPLTVKSGLEVQVKTAYIGSLQEEERKRA
tara:strand:+ start:96 stop:332 length:237 start_codon:yes stop_codon:yes gene_type:complete